jgi:hypothetical protein
MEIEEGMIVIPGSFRIGNVVEWHLEGKVEDWSLCKVTEITEEDFTFSLNGKSVVDKFVCPLFIQEEDFELLGFHAGKTDGKFENAWNDDISSIRMSIDINGGALWNMQMYREYKNGIKQEFEIVAVLYFLHNLQNAYFMLTGSDLNVDILIAGFLTSSR